MSATLVIDIDPNVLASAEQSAKARNTTISEVVEMQLRWMAENWRQGQAGKTPVTDSLRGIAREASTEPKEILTTELLKKHGIQG